jgi:hypothetical protein
MDDPTRWCENDASIETRLLGPPDPKRGPLFFFTGAQNSMLMSALRNRSYLAL